MRAMVKDLLTLSDRYRSLGPRFAKAFEFAKNTDFASMPDGTYSLDGTEVRALVQRYTTKPAHELRWEAHRKHIDLQFVLTGEEHIGVVPIGRLAADPYDDEKDIMWLDGDGDRVTLRPGDFVLLWPEDAHMPARAIDTPMPVLKVVIKILIPQG